MDGIGADLGRGRDVGQAGRQRLRNRRRVDAEQSGILQRDRNRAAVARIDGRQHLVGVDENGRRQFHVGAFRAYRAAILPQASPCRRVDVGQVLTTDDLRREFDRIHLPGENRQVFPAGRLAVDDGGRSGSRAERRSHRRGQVAQPASEHVGKDNVPRSARTSVDRRQRPRHDIILGVDHFREFGEEHIGRKGQRRTAAIGDRALLTRNTVVATGVFVVKRRLQRCSATVAMKLHVQMQRRRRRRGEGVAVEPVVTGGIGRGVERRNTAEIESREDGIGIGYQVQADVIGPHIGGALDIDRHGVLAAGFHLRRNVAHGNLHLRGEAAHRDTFLEAGACRTGAVAGYAQIEVGPIVEARIGAHRRLRNGRPVGNHHRRAGHGDRACRRNLRQDELIIDQSLDVSGRTARCPIADHDPRRVADVMLVVECLGEDHPLPGRRNRQRGEGIGIHDRVGRIGAVGCGLRVRPLARADNRIAALDMRRRRGRRHLATVLTVGPRRRDDVRRRRSAQRAAGNNRGSEDRLQCRGGGDQPRNVAPRPNGEDGAAVGIPDEPPLGHGIGDECRTGNACRIDVDRRRYILTEIDLLRHRLGEREVRRRCDQMPWRKLRSIRVIVMTPILVCHIEPEHSGR